MFEQLNPWWEFKNWEKRDKQLLYWKKMEIRWVPKWINDISLEPFSLNFIIGPRQVGKTTGIKLLIKRLIEKGVEPERITFLSCDPIIDAFHLKKLLEEYFEMREREDILILDEVTVIEDWWKVIKGFVDMGKFEDTVIILSGSTSLKLKKRRQIL